MKEKKSDRIWNIVSFLLPVLVFGVEFQLLWRIHKLHMLPVAYFWALTGGMVLVSALPLLLLFRKKKGKFQKKQGVGKRVLGYLLCAVLLAGCLLGSIVVGRVQNTINAITGTEIINVVLEVYVRTEDDAQAIQDTAGYCYAVAEDMQQGDVQKILGELEAVLGEAVETRYYPNSRMALDALLAGQTDAMILDSAYISVLNSMEGYENVQSRVRLLHEHVIEKEVPQKPKPVKPEGPKTASVTDSPFLIYISGNDARRTFLADGGSDVNILMLVNARNHQILLINTPRDYYVVNPASGNGSRDKLSHCGLRGIDNCIGALSELYGLDIEYYARINFTGFETLIDAIGGVTIHSDIGFHTSKVYIQKGENHLNGAQALSYARERKNLAGGDNDRGKNQMKLIGAMIQQLSVGNLISNYAGILESLEGMFSTNFPAKDIGKLVQFQLTEMPSWEILTFAVTGDNGNDFCWGVSGYGYVMYPHEHMVDHAASLMERFLAGEKLTAEDMTVNP